MIKYMHLLLLGLILTIGISICNTDEVNAALYAPGSSGEMVEKIQTRLKNWGYYKGDIDGKYGDLTFAAVRHFQRQNNLQESGTVESLTLEAIGLPIPRSSSSSSNEGSSRESDLWLLACVINGEGRGESYLGQVAIGAVIMNRVNHPSFPNTISGVIYQSGAFDAVKDGQINLIPSESCINAARDAINGWDPVDGALYYWNPKIATSKWVLKLTVIKTIGNHTFAVH